MTDEEDVTRMSTLHWKPSRNEARQLKRAGYDGLYFPGECACLAEDLYPCGERQEDCRPGVKKPCDCYEHDWHIGEREAEDRIPVPPVSAGWSASESGQSNGGTRDSGVSTRRLRGRQGDCGTLRVVRKANKPRWPFA